MRKGEGSTEGKAGGGEALEAERRRRRILADSRRVKWLENRSDRLAQRCDASLPCSRAAACLPNLPADRPCHCYCKHAISALSLLWAVSHKTRSSCDTLPPPALSLPSASQ